VFYYQLRAPTFGITEDANGDVFVVAVWRLGNKVIVGKKGV